MNTVLLFIAGLAALSGLLAVMIYLLAVSREMQLPD
jgi:cytochrome P450